MADELIVIDGELLNRRRLARGWTKAALAERAGLSFAPTKRALDGKPVGLCTAGKLANAIGLAVSRLIVNPGVASDSGAASVVEFGRGAGIVDDQWGGPRERESKRG